MEGKNGKKKPGNSGTKGQEDFYLHQKQSMENPFSIPQGYFDTLPDRIHDRIAREKQLSPVRPFPRMIILAASAAAILVIVAFTIFLKSEYNNYGNQRFIAGNNNTTNELAMSGEFNPAESDSSKKVSPNVNKLPQTPAPASKPAQSPEKNTTDKQIKVIKALAEEGVSQEDILQYLLEENYDPSETIN